MLFAKWRRERRRKKRQQEREAWTQIIREHIAEIGQEQRERPEPNDYEEGEFEIKLPPLLLTVERFHWLTKNNVRHNNKCGWYENCGGRPCGATEGRPCRICGG